MLDARTLSLLMLSFGTMSNKKLQKICYYMYSWYLAINRTRVADIQFEAWVHGPVSREIYNMYKGYGWENIPCYQGFIPVNDDIIEFAGKVWNIYGRYSADQLEEISHRELPWKNARKYYSKYESSDVLLDDEDIFCFYNAKYKESNCICV